MFMLQTGLFCSSGDPWRGLLASPTLPKPLRPPGTLKGHWLPAEPQSLQQLWNNQNWAKPLKGWPNFVSQGWVATHRLGRTGLSYPFHFPLKNCNVICTRLNSSIPHFPCESFYHFRQCFAKKPIFHGVKIIMMLTWKAEEAVLGLRYKPEFSETQQNLLERFHKQTTVISDKQVLSFL